MKRKPKVISKKVAAHLFTIHGVDKGTRKDKVYVAPSTVSAKDQQKLMTTCVNCKFWNKQEGIKENLVEIGVCMHRMVCRPTYGNSDTCIMKADGVLTCDEGGATGCLMTAPLFGCIHGVAK